MCNLQILSEGKNAQVQKKPTLQGNLVHVPTGPGVSVGKLARIGCWHSAKTRSSIATMGRRLAFMCLGACVGVLFAVILSLALHRHVAIGPQLFVLALPFGVQSVAIAERRKKVKSIEEINRPISLFPNSENR